jgi:TolA-binding protein
MSKSKIQESQTTDELNPLDEAIEFEEVDPRRASSQERVSGSLQKNRVLIGGILGGLVLVVGGYFVYDYLQSEKQEEAEKQLFMPFKAYEKDSLAQAIAGSGQFPGVKRMAENYSGTPAGELATYMLGTAYLAQGKINEGASALKDFKKPKDNMVSASAYAALGYAYEEQGQFEEAAKQYLKAADVMPNEHTSPEFLHQAALCYLEAKNKDKAASIFRDLKRKYPLSEKGQQADKYLAQVSQ